MFGFFRKLLGKNGTLGAPSLDKERFNFLNTAAPLKSSRADDGFCFPEVAGYVDAVHSEEKAPAYSFVCREPVLNRAEKISGYKFSLHEKTQLRLQGEMDLLQKVYDDVLLRTLTSLGVNALLGNRQAFVRLLPVSLGNPLIDQLPVRNTVLMLTPARQTLDVEALQPQLGALCQKGFACGWLIRKPQLAEHPELLALAARADYVEIETSTFDGMDIKLLLKSLSSLRPADLPKIQHIANGLNTFDEFHLCFQGGFDCFLGEFVTSRENWHPPQSDINRLHVIELLNLLRGGAEFDLIAKKLKVDPVLTFKLLRYLNSPVMGMQSPITTMDKALIVLGRERFYRWLSLLLFDIKSPGYREHMLVEQALARAHFLESLAGQGRLPPQKDQLFMLGLFSMLDLLMGQPMSAIVTQTKLPAPVQGALLGQPGPYRDAVLLAIAAEGLSPDAVQQQAATCDLSAVQVCLSAVEALTWANEVTTINNDD